MKKLLLVALMLMVGGTAFAMGWLPGHSKPDGSTTNVSVKASPKPVNPKDAAYLACMALIKTEKCVFDINSPTYTSDYSKCYTPEKVKCDALKV